MNLVKKRRPTKKYQKAKKNSKKCGEFYISLDYKHIIYKGKLYTVDRYGYYQNSKNGRQSSLHRDVWVDNHSGIPKGYIIHHIDGDKSNNNIKNLQILPPSEHSSIHSSDPSKIEKIQKACAEARSLRRKQSVCAYCGTTFTTSGVAIHKYCSDLCNKRISKKKKKTKVLTCCFCGKNFLVNPKTEQKYCSHQCATQNQMEENKVHKICGFCSKEFTTNGNSNGKKEQKYCSKKCMKKAWRQRQRDSGGRVT